MKSKKNIENSSQPDVDKSIIKLIVEGEEGSLWGRVEYEDNLIVDEADSIEQLQKQMANLLLDFHDLDPKSYEFFIEFDLTAFFIEFDFLKMTKIAELSGLNGSLVRQYATGKKHPSAKQAEKIENAVKQLAQQLSNVHIYAR
ncbi:hypothetical protein MUK70_29010 [Dyadobacter chenwenxiniae]|uniref:Uncharacterized protein n=1 Tax=Dyadobacter chenwenxiniae TaxID=2906456 RepID=A0A9X1PSL6_9BACT|nr:hypothetical protein [Dyadobacter chenwenxiniae]MCF0050038.1 hypothetical protein [Dyadobacter chenwenxiniae]MCF0064923.1 hypothetical protein [Dyadobacter chenwenxiniae]UON83045.1 hypothetical protein MUK70_29010 [Dyadobacter chenwenxiniae]